MARISCRNLRDLGTTTSGSYYLKVNGRSFQVSLCILYKKLIKALAHYCHSLCKREERRVSVLAKCATEAWVGEGLIERPGRRVMKLN